MRTFILFFAVIFSMACDGHEISDEDIVAFNTLKIYFIKHIWPYDVYLSAESIEGGKYSTITEAVSPLYIQYFVNTISWNDIVDCKNYAELVNSKSIQLMIYLETYEKKYRFLSDGGFLWDADRELCMSVDNDFLTRFDILK